MKRLKLRNIFFFTAIFFSITVAQTKSFGNYEIYTYETSRSGFGFLTSEIKFPGYLQNYKFLQKGLLYTYQYFQNEITNINITHSFRVRFITEGNFNIGGGYSTNLMEQTLGNNGLYRSDVKMYSANLDLFAYDFDLEATYVFPNAMAITTKLGINIFSIGATAALPKGGKVKDDMFGVVNLLPLVFRPQLLIDLGRSVFGIGFIIQSKNFVEYKYVPNNLFISEDKGIIFNDSFITNFAVQIFWKY